MGLLAHKATCRPLSVAGNPQLPGTGNPVHPPASRSVASTASNVRQIAVPRRFTAWDVKEHVADSSTASGRGEPRGRPPGLPDRQHDGQAERPGRAAPAPDPVHSIPTSMVRHAMRRRYKKPDVGPPGHESDRDSRVTSGRATEGQPAVVSRRGEGRRDERRERGLAGGQAVGNKCYMYRGGDLDRKNVGQRRRRTAADRGRESDRGIIEKNKRARGASRQAHIRAGR